MKKKIYIILGAILILFIAALIINFFREKDHVAVLCYHNIATKEERENFPEEKEYTIDVENFEKELKYLKQHNYKTLTMEEFYNWKKGNIKIPIKSVLITFDDGFLSNYEYAFPLLKKYDMNATVFIVGEFIENANQEQWSGNIKTYMTKDLIKKAKDEYKNIEFCSHTYGLHYENSIDENDVDEIERDLIKNEELFGKSEFLAYPFGAVNDKIITALKKCDYKLGFIYGPQRDDFRKANINDEDFKIPRLNVSHDMPMWKFILRLWI